MTINKLGKIKNKPIYLLHYYFVFLVLLLGNRIRKPIYIFIK